MRHFSNGLHELKRKKQQDANVASPSTPSLERMCICYRVKSRNSLFRDVFVRRYSWLLCKGNGFLWILGRLICELGSARNPNFANLQLFRAEPRLDRARPSLTRRQAIELMDPTEDQLPAKCYAIAAPQQEPPILCSPDQKRKRECGM